MAQIGGWFRLGAPKVVKPKGLPLESRRSTLGESGYHIPAEPPPRKRQRLVCAVPALPTEMPTSLRIGVNALYLIPGGVGGTEIYLRNLLEALAQIDDRNRYFVFTSSEAGSEICPAAPNFEAVVSRTPARFRPARLIWEQTGLPIQTVKHRLDVLFSPGFTSPLVARGKKVTVIHDLQHKRQPKNFGLLERAAWNCSVWQSVKSSHLLLTPSETSRNDVLAVYGVRDEKVRAVLHGVEPRFFHLGDNPAYGARVLRETGVPECAYLLAVSTIHPHKNFVRLLEAYGQLAAEGWQEHLVVAGLPGKSWKAVHRLLNGKDWASRVHLVGWQRREVILSLFNNAEALVFPSTFEGFGMPVLEAMASGLPVVCSDIPVLREIANGAAQFFDPTSSSAIAEGVHSALRDPTYRAELIKRGRRRAADFSWRRAAEQTLAAFLEVA